MPSGWCFDWFMYFRRTYSNTTLKRGLNTDTVGEICFRCSCRYLFLLAGHCGVWGTSWACQAGSQTGTARPKTNFVTLLLWVLITADGGNYVDDSGSPPAAVQNMCDKHSSDVRACNIRPDNFAGLETAVCRLAFAISRSHLAYLFE